MKNITAEMIAAALMQNGTVKSTAQALGVCEKTLYKRMQEDDFKVAYEEIQESVLDVALNNLQSKLSSAIDTMCDIMNNADVNAAVRLQAATGILKYCILAAETKEQLELRRQVAEW